MRDTARGDIADDLLFGPFFLDGRQGILTREGMEVPLTPKLVETLRVLAEAAGAVVTKDDLVARVWPDTAVTDSSLTQNIWLLRRAIEHEGERYIETVPRRGYRLSVPVSFRRAAAEAARSRPALRIPRPLSSFVGREREIRALAALMDDSQTTLVTITGPGGVGKTRLAINVAERALARFHGGAWLVDLSTVPDPLLVTAAIARALSIDDDLHTPLVEAIAARLSSGLCLLVLDNLEHLVEAAGVVSAIMARAPSLRVMVTSRVLLRVAGERAFPVGPLPLPPDGASAEEVAGSDAVTLFVQRVRAHRPSFSVTTDNQQSVTAICRRLDGLPLALELAAARMRILSADDLAAQLAAGVSPGPGTRDAAERHRTMTAALDWGYALLEAGPRTRFAGLSVFAGGFTLEAVGAVTGPDALEDMQTLVDSSFVAVVDGPDDVRFRLLETIRQYADSHLDESGRSVLRRAHATHFLAAAERTAPWLASSRRRIALDRLEVDHHNFQAADATLAASDAEGRLRLAVALGPYWHMRGHWLESRSTTRAALDSCPGAPDRLRCAAWLQLGRIDFFMGDEERAHEAFERALVLARASGDSTLLARALDASAQGRLKVGQDEEGGRLALEAVEAARRSTDTATQAEALTTLGTARAAGGGYAQARALLEEALGMAAAIGDESLAMRVRYYLAGVALLEGDREAALAVGAAEAGDTVDESWAHHLREMRGRALLEAGHRDVAATLISASLDAMDAVGSRSCIPHGVEAAARLALADGDTDRAAELLGAAERTCREFGVAMLPIERALFQDTAAKVRAAAPAERTEAAWESGRRWAVSDVLPRARAACRRTR